MQSKDCLVGLGTQGRGSTTAAGAADSLLVVLVDAPCVGCGVSRLPADFERFHAENPQVYRLFERFTFDAIYAGRTRFSSDAVLHRIRWYTNIETKDEAGFKINDHWTAFYARLFMRNYPQHKGFFSLRTAAADEPNGHTFDAAGQGCFV